MTFNFWQISKISIVVLGKRELMPLKRIYTTDKRIRLVIVAYIAILRKIVSKTCAQSIVSIFIHFGISLDLE